MKLDEEVKMISAEAPIIFAKAAEIFIQEVTIRAWLHTEENKRRTLQRNDVALAVSKYDQFDFLIDIVPREEIKPTTTANTSTTSSSASKSTKEAHATPQQQSMSHSHSPQQHHHHQVQQQVAMQNVLNQQLPMGATILDAQTASLLLNGGAATTTGTNGAAAGQVQYIFAMAPNGTMTNGMQAIQGLPPGAQIILNSNGQPTIFSMANRTDC